MRALAILFALLVAVPASAQTFPAPTGRVIDEANLLSPAEEAYLTGRLAALEARTTDQLLVLTVPSLDGRTIEAFGMALRNHWDIGQSGKGNGVLLIVAPNERRIRIEVGYGLERILTDARAQAIIADDILPQFIEARWYEGIRAGARSIVATLVEHEREPRRSLR